MLSNTNLAIVKRSSLRARQALAERMDLGRRGVEVVISVDGRDNDPEHNSLGELKAGDVATIAGGEYFTFLKGKEMVVSVADAEAALAADTTTEPSPEPEPTPAKKGKKTASAEA